MVYGGKTAQQIEEDKVIKEALEDDEAREVEKGKDQDSLEL
jgi:hypothetical protein